MSVDLPAPFGPSRPMALPCNWPVRPSRTVRPPSRTSSPSSSITLMSVGYVLRRRFVPAIEDGSEGKKIKAKKTAVSGCLDAIVLSPCTDHCGARVGCKFPKRVSCFSADSREERREDWIQILIGDRGVVLVRIAWKQGAERCGVGQGIAVGVRAQRVYQLRTFRRHDHETIGVRVLRQRRAGHLVANRIVLPAVRGRCF